MKNKLTDSERDEVVRLVRAGMKYHQVGELHGMSKTTICRIVHAATKRETAERVGAIRANQQIVVDQRKRLSV